MQSQRNDHQGSGDGRGMTIKPVEDRAIRPCRGCVLHWYEQDGSEVCKKYGKIDRLKHYDLHVGSRDVKYLEINPCIYNLFLVEYEELFKSGLLSLGGIRE